jgi:hypothetical protein
MLLVTVTIRIGRGGLGAQISCTLFSSHRDCCMYHLTCSAICVIRASHSAGPFKSLLQSAQAYFIHIHDSCTLAVQEDVAERPSEAEEVQDEAAHSQTQSTPAAGVSSDAALTSTTTYSDHFSTASPVASADAEVEAAAAGSTLDERQEDASASSGSIAESFEGSEEEDESYEEDFATDEAQPSSSQAAEGSHAEQEPHQPSNELPADVMLPSEGGASLLAQQPSPPASEAAFPAEQSPVHAAADIPSTAEAGLLGSGADGGHRPASDSGDADSTFSGDILEEAEASGVQPEESWCSSPDAFAPQPLQVEGPMVAAAVEGSRGLLQEPVSDSIPAALDEFSTPLLPGSADHSAAKQCSTVATEPAEHLATDEYSADAAWSKQDELAAEGGGGHHDSSCAAQGTTQGETSHPENAADLKSGTPAGPDCDEAHHQRGGAAEPLQSYYPAPGCGSSAPSLPADGAPEASAEMDDRASQLEAIQESSAGMLVEAAAPEASKDTDVYSEESYSYVSEDPEEMQLLAAQEMLNSGQGVLQLVPASPLHNMSWVGVTARARGCLICAPQWPSCLINVCCSWARKWCPRCALSRTRQGWCTFTPP